jgi:DNA gyrase subunit B
LRETTLDPAKRLLKQVAMEDAAVAARLVAALMEEGNAELRRDFLARHAREVEEVDV